MTSQVRLCLEIIVIYLVSSGGVTVESTNSVKSIHNAIYIILHYLGNRSKFYNYMIRVNSVVK